MHDGRRSETRHAHSPMVRAEPSHSSILPSAPGSQRQRTGVGHVSGLQSEKQKQPRSSSRSAPVTLQMRSRSLNGHGNHMPAAQRGSGPTQLNSATVNTAICV